MGSLLRVSDGASLRHRCATHSRRLPNWLNTPLPVHPEYAGRAHLSNPGRHDADAVERGTIDQLGAHDGVDQHVLVRIARWDSEGRVPANYFTAMFIPAGDEDANLSSQNAIKIADKKEMMRATKMIDDVGYYGPSCTPNPYDKYLDDEDLED
jgi:hypothetical protein